MLEHLVNPVADIAYPNLDEDVIEKAKLCILHSLSCSYAGRHERWSTAARELEMSYGGNGNSSLWFTKYKSDAAGAAFCNAAAAQSILYEDIHRESPQALPQVLMSGLMQAQMICTFKMQWQRGMES